MFVALLYGACFLICQLGYEVTWDEEKQSVACVHTLVHADRAEQVSH